MLQSIVGPPMVGATELKSQPERSGARDFKGSDSESSFGKALEGRLTSKSPKEVKDSPQKEMRQKDENEKPQKAEIKESRTEVANTEGKISKKATDRQKAIQEFMDSFESEFEISPTRLVEAMAQLDDKQLAQSPEATADAVVDQLNLSDEDADKARSMYAGLLMQLNQISAAPQKPKAPELTSEVAVSHQNIQARVLASQEKQNLMGASVDRLNKSFWMRQEPKALPLETHMMPAETAWAQRAGLEASLQEGMSIADETEEFVLPEESMAEGIPADMPAMNPEGSLKELPPHLQGQMKETASPALLAALAAKHAEAKKAMAEAEQSADGPALTAEFQQALQAPKAETPAMQGKTASVMSQNQKANQEFFQNQSQGQSLMQQNSGQFAQKGFSEGAATVEKLVEKSADFKSGLTGLESVHGAPIKGDVLRSEVMAPVVTPGATAPTNSAESEAAVKQLMNQAQYLIKKGGGEMKVQMTPEGMGTVHLKVMLQDGKVNVQMSADTQEAKKTIESSLAELKTSLAAHKLSMENVKVDVVNATSADTAAQNQTDLNGQNQRDQARQFWNQFNDNFGSQGRKESFMEMPNLRGYGLKGRDPLQPIETSGRTQARKVEGKGSGLNLVA